MRYQIYNGSQSDHCCFKATVVDTTKPDIIGGEHYKGSDGQYHYKSVCECFSVEDAEKVRDALNSVESAKNPYTPKRNRSKPDGRMDRRSPQSKTPFPCNHPAQPE